MKTSDFTFDLPEDLIANQPFFPKEETKMLVYKDNQILDAKIINLIDFLQEGDVLVFNDAKVIKAKLSAKILRNKIEVAKIDLNLDQETQGIWSALCRPAKKVKEGDILEIAPNFTAQVLAKTDDGFIKIKFNCDSDKLIQNLEEFGSVPLPPYIKREQENSQDQKNYQTIYAKNGVAVAAPTAGLHFNENIFKLLDQKKIKKVFVTLNVGAGTFLPVRSDIVAEHKMHHEFFSISKQAAEIINLAKKSGKKIIAVGTTSLRALESSCDSSGFIIPNEKSTNIFIYPPYQVKSIDILMTNFHLPKSTLFMLICALIGKDQAFEIYHHAIKNRYRFYSYGDSSLLFCK